jgi:sugar lactone lactonase YvrE
MPLTLEAASDQSRRLYCGTPRGLLIGGTTMIQQLETELALNTRDIIGEGPAWDAAGQRLIWSDNETGVIHAARADADGTWREAQRWELQRGIAGAIPRSRGGLVVASGTEILLLSPDGTTSLFAQIDADPNLAKSNEAKCDPQGRLWVGTRALDLSSSSGALYRIDPDRTVKTMLTGAVISNGLDWSPDGSTFYYIDSATRVVAAFDFDATQGTIKNRRAVVAPEWGQGAPDGMTVDCEGCLWVALVGSGAVHRYAPDGTLLARAEISTPAITSCAFGGHDGTTLFITSLGRAIPEIAVNYGVRPEMIQQSATAKEGGSLFLCRPGVAGPPATPFAG